MRIWIRFAQFYCVSVKPPRAEPEAGSPKRAKENTRRGVAPAKHPHFLRVVFFCERREDGAGFGGGRFARSALVLSAWRRCPVSFGVLSFGGVFYVCFGWLLRFSLVAVGIFAARFVVRVGGCRGWARRGGRLRFRR
jgi:hypothetical protein